MANKFEIRIRHKKCRTKSEILIKSRRILRNLFFNLTSNFSLLTSFFLATFSFAQTPEWVYQYVNPGFSDVPYAIAVDSAGSTYTTGYVGLGNNGGLGVIKLDDQGNELWMYWNDLGTAMIGHSVALHADRVYIGGYMDSLGTKRIIVACIDTLGDERWVFKDTVNTGQGFAIGVSLFHNIYIAGKKYPSPPDWAIVKLDSLGNECWRYVYDGPAGSYDQAGSIAIDKDENIYVGGYSTGFGTAEDFTVLKLDSAGHLLWEYRYDGPAHDWDEPNAMALDTFGNIYIAGRSWGINWDFCVVKIDSSSQEEWVYRYNGLANVEDLLYDLTVDDSGNVYLSGISKNDTLQLFTIIKVDSGGNERWCYIDTGPDGYKGGIADRVEVDGLGGIYGAGFLRNMWYRPQIAVVKLNPSGDLLWRYIYPHVPPVSYGFDKAQAIVADVNGNIYVAGKINVGPWNDDIVVMKFASSQGVVKEVMKNEIREKSKNATIFKGGIEFLPEEDCGLKVYDVSGRVVIEKILQSGKRESIRLLSGVYFIVIEGENGKRVKKVIVL